MRTEATTRFFISGARLRRALEAFLEIGLPQAEGHGSGLAARQLDPIDGDHRTHKDRGGRDEGFRSVLGFVNGEFAFFDRCAAGRRIGSSVRRG
jgi:hypothetical protein